MISFGVHQPESLLVKGSQSVEQLIRNEKVGGSIPLSGTSIGKGFSVLGWCGKINGLTPG